MKKILFFIGIASFLILTGCHHGDNTGAGPSPFQGNWQFIFYGPYTEGGIIYIDSGGEFSGNLNMINPNGDNIVITMKEGTVSSSGGLFAHLNYNKNQVGTMYGHLDKSSGSGEGTYMSLNQSINGTWTAGLQ